MASVLSQLMGQWMDVQGLLIFLCVLLLVKHLRDVLTNIMPPGPFPLPLIGNVLNIGFSDPLGSFQRIAERYGDVSTLYLGNKPCILLTGYESFKEAFVEQADVFTDRPYFPVNDRICNGQGLIFSSGHMWHHQRRFALATLKYFGVGKKTLENSILQECRFVCSALQTKQADHMPGKHQTAFANLSKLKHFFKEEIMKHKEDRNPSSPRDYIDCYLDEIEKCKGSEAEFTEENLIHCVLDLFGAGTESTAKSLSWAVLYMAKYPEVQEKVHSEIDQVIGQTRQPLMEDRAHLPYTYAVMHEIQRFANVLAFIPPRVANKDTTVAGCLIPKGVMVLPMLKPILEDKNEYCTPYEFNPAHFLDENGKFLKRENFIPFSIAHTMPCNKSSINNCCKVGRFPSLRVKSDDCSKVKCSVPVLKNPCSCVTCCGREAVVVQDDCKYSGACGKQVYGCIKPVCQHNPCSNLTSCHDHVVKTVIQDDCESWRRCGNEEFVSFPVNKWKCACCTPGCDQMPLQLTDRKL
ncbi:hypothetical protein cypCar_00031964 [Cyprinus carpio]|nr:hypothetical protein cypCar_00031964 [Cyprinus carpio]